MEEIKHLQIISLNKDLDWYDEEGYFSSLLQSLNCSEPLIRIEYENSKKKLEIPSVEVLGDCIQKRTTRGILDPLTHYIVVFLLNLTGNEARIPLNINQVSLPYYGTIQNITNILHWRGRAYEIKAEPYDMYFTDPEFHERFIQRLQEFVSELKIIKNHTAHHKVNFCYLSQSDELPSIEIFHHPDIYLTPIVLYTSLTYLVTENVTDEEPGKAIYNCMLHLMNVTDTIWKVVVMWSTDEISRKYNPQLFEPRLIYNILDFLRFKREKIV
jgi:hypothetical protein